MAKQQKLALTKIQEIKELEKNEIKNCKVLYIRRFSSSDYFPG